MDSRQPLAQIGVSSLVQRLGDQMTEVSRIDILRVKENGSFTFQVEVKANQGESGHEVTL